MAGEVTICNLALGHLGDTATVASIAPPDNSIQAQLCARFYPIARNSMLEMYSWGFSTMRAPLALLDLPTVAGDGLTWQYAYAVPNGLLNAISVLPADATDDYQEWYPYQAQDQLTPYAQGYVPVPGVPVEVTQPYSMESMPDGTQIILTNVEDAVLRYTGIVTDTTKFSWLFTLALSWLLASMLAGPILKGDAGMQVGMQCMSMFKQIEAQAEASDANQRKTALQPSPPWIRGR